MIEKGMNCFCSVRIFSSNQKWFTSLVKETVVYGTGDGGSSRISAFRNKWRSVALPHDALVRQGAPPRCPAFLLASGAERLHEGEEKRTQTHLGWIFI